MPRCEWRRTTASGWSNCAATSTRPALSDERVQLNAAGQVELELKTPWREGTTHLVMSPMEQAGSGFYQEWLRHLDIHHMLGAVFQAADGVIGVLGIYRTREAGAHTEVERSKVAPLLPHLQRALRLGRRLSALSHAHAASAVFSKSGLSLKQPELAARSASIRCRRRPV
jgi:hypothetical protein